MGRMSRTLPRPFDDYADVYSGELFWQCEECGQGKYEDVHAARSEYGGRD
jgi:hypothetical protein